MTVTVLSTPERATATMSLYQDIKLKRRKAENSSSIRCGREPEPAVESMVVDSAPVEAASDSPDSGLSSGHSDSGSSGMSLTSPPITSPPDSPPPSSAPPPSMRGVREMSFIASSHHTPSPHQPPQLPASVVVKSERPSILESHLLCERRSPDSPSERPNNGITRLDFSRHEQPPSPMYGTEEQHVSSTPIGLGAAPSIDRMTPSPSSYPITSHSQTTISKLAAPLHGSSLGAGGITPYNLSSVATTASLFPLNGLITSSSGLMGTNGYSSSLVSSSGHLPGGGLMSSGSHSLLRNSIQSFEYQSTLEKARLNGIVPEIIRGGELLHNPDSKNGQRPHNNTTNTVILGAAGGFKTMFWVPDKPRESLNNSTPPRVTLSNDIRASVDGMLSLSRGIPVSSCSVSAASSPSPAPHRRSPYLVPGHISPQENLRNLFKPSHSPPVFNKISQNNSPVHYLRDDLSEPMYKKLNSNPVRSMPIDMDLLWKGDKSQLPQVALDPITAMNMANKVDQYSGGRIGTTHGRPTTGSGDEDDPPLICMICDDTATGLHYGIITCEGCKGFFKRTVQNKRVYNCAADGQCEVNKQQRNRCQYCRFRKCLDKGMVLAAVREDRMPGGRNSGAVYNLYKVKYKKKKNKQNAGQRNQGYSIPDRGSMMPGKVMSGKDMASLMETSMSSYSHQARLSPASSSSTTPSSHSSPPPHSNVHTNAFTTAITLHQVMASAASPTSTLAPHHRSFSPDFSSGNILKAALTNPAEVAHFRHRQSEPLSLASLERERESRERSLAYPKAQQVIRELKQNDRFEECALMKLLPEFDKPEDLTKDSGKRNPILYDEPQENAEFFFADKVACNLMQWISHLPFGDTSANYLLSASCFGLVVFNAAFFLHHKKEHKFGLPTAEYYNRELMEEMTANITALKRGLRETSMSGAQQEDLLTRWVPITEKLSEFTIFFNAFQMEESEFLLLKVIMYTMKAKPDMTEILEVDKLYRGYLHTYCQTHSPSQPNRATDLLKKISEISEVSHNLLLFDTSRLKVPFLICDNR